MRPGWMGPEATLLNFADTDRANRVFTAPAVSGYVDYLSELPGLPRGGYEIKSISEFMRLTCFIIARAADLKYCIVFYAGGNQNVVTWPRHRMAGSRVAKYFVRILNSLGNEGALRYRPRLFCP